MTPKEMLDYIKTSTEIGGGVSVDIGTLHIPFGFADKKAVGLILQLLEDPELNKENIETIQRIFQEGIFWINMMMVLKHSDEMNTKQNQQTPDKQTSLYHGQIEYKVKK